MKYCVGVLLSGSFSSQLPDYVFDEGERQPRSAQKRPKTKVRPLALLRLR